MIANPTEQQAAFIAAIQNGVQPGDPADVGLIARAGSGKTSTILHAVEVRPRGQHATLCAYNARIAKELESRTAGWDRVNAKTLHGIGKRTIENAFPRARIRVDKDRETKIAKWVCGEQEPELVISSVARLAAQVKECAPDEATTPAAIERVGADLGILPDDEELESTNWDVAQVLEAAARVVEVSVDVMADGLMSFADMLYVPLAQRLRPWQSDLVFVDEAQDMNLAQLRLAVRIRQVGGRVIVVGDDRQAIYSWKGAAPGALEHVCRALGAKVMRLTVTHRCAQRIVAEAQRIVPDLQAAPGAPEGIVRGATWGQCISADGARPGDFVIGRTNAVLAIACLRLLRNGTRATIAGGDLGKTLVALVKRLAAGAGDDLVKLVERLELWRARQVKKAELRGSDTGVRDANDRADTIAAIADDCDGIAELRAKIERLFAEDGAASVVCTTVHKAKGLEVDRAWILRESFDAMRPRTDVQAIEEQNLRYVAYTRARHELVYVDGTP